MRTAPALYERWHAGAEKFDYFVTGGTGALCGLIVQTSSFGRIGFNPCTLELVALLALLTSVAAGFMTLKKGLVAARRDQEETHLWEEAEYFAVRADEAADDSKFLDPRDGTVFGKQELQARAVAARQDALKLQPQTSGAYDSANAWSAVRDATLLVGFLMLIAARVWTPYL